ncbi:hypothetical protein [Scytonema sp. PRP1]|uniref:hypothetical protein n=1 Tax=Scytonema sp. PRP1 TaxID=3120513 RepID=UPI002FD16766
MSQFLEGDRPKGSAQSAIAFCPLFHEEAVGLLLRCPDFLTPVVSPSGKKFKSV